MKHATLLGCLALLSFPLLSSAQQSAQMTSQNGFTTGKVIAPLGSFRLEFRIHDLPAALSGWNYSVIMNLPPGFLMRFMGSSFNGPLSLQDNQDTFPAGQSNVFYFDTAGRTDVILRIQRDTVNMVFQAEIWNADGTGYQSGSLPIQAVNPFPLPWSGTVGGGPSSFSLAYVRMFTNIVKLGTLPFGEPTGDLIDLSFPNGILNAPHSLFDLSATSVPSFTSTPTYSPYISQGAQRTMSGASAQLDGSQCFSLNNVSPQLTYQWSQISGPTNLSWSSQSVAQPEVYGLSFGSYVIRLTVTDSTGVSSTSTLKYGDVAVDSNGHVVPPQPWVTTLFGEMLPWGTNPWPYFESQHKELADYFGGLQATNYTDVWNTAGTGTITVTNGSAEVTGSGTSFASIFCGGGNQPVNGATLIIWYPVSGSPGQFGRRPYGVSQCNSNNSLTLSRLYITSDSATGLNFAFMDNNSIGTWINGSNNVNYYDNVLAFYNLYYRSGIDDYLGYAQTLADRWWTMPWIDQGRDCSDGDGSTCLFPRLQSVTGLVARALEGRPDMWPGLRALINYDYGFTNVTTVGDLREDSYATAFVALAALFDPDPSSQAAWQANTTSLISNLWIPNVQPDGSWNSPSYGYASWNGAAGTVTVTNGSNLVVGSGTQWEADWFNGNAFWTANLDMTDGDPISYTATYLSPTLLQLNTPYQGQTQSGRSWQASNLVGYGIEPFMLGVAGTAFRYSYLATNDGRIPPLIAGIANWLSTTGYRSDARGLWYGRVYPNCEPISIDNQWCSGGTVEQSRFLGGQIVSALSEAYSLSNSLSLLLSENNFYAAMYGGSGGPLTDSTYVTDISDGGWAMQTQSTKDFGFFYGFGFGSVWPAVTSNTREKSTQ